MGLDMYLYKRKPEIPIFDEYGEQIGILFGEKEEVAYWRNAYYTFRLFEEEIGEIENDDNYEIDIDAIMRIHDKCVLAIDNCENNLSHGEIKNTIRKIEKVVSSHNDNDKFIFNADW